MFVFYEKASGSHVGSRRERETGGREAHQRATAVVWSVHTSLSRETERRVLGRAGRWLNL